jgi:drug/metabolite transporter (DMT)-like permease
MVALGSSVAASSLLIHYPVLSGQALRYGLAALVLMGALQVTGRGLPRPSPREALQLVTLATVGAAAFNVLLLAAVRENDPSAVGVIVGATPIVLALLGPMTEQRVPSRTVIAAAVLVGLGSAAAQGAGGRITALGVLLSIGALACESAFSLLAVSLLRRLGPLAVSAYVSVVACALLTAVSLTIDGLAGFVVPGMVEAAALLYLAVVVTAAGFVAWYAGIGRLTVERAGLFAGLVPVSALITVAILGTGHVTPLRAAGALVVGAGVTLGLWSPGPRGQQASAKGY